LLLAASQLDSEHQHRAAQVALVLILHLAAAVAAAF
jgi:hypothetical protein